MSLSELGLWEKEQVWEKIKLGILGMCDFLPE